MKDRFFFRSGDRIHGPITFAALVDLLRDGTLCLEDSVRPQGQQNWRRIEDVMGSLLSQYPEITRTAVAQDPARTRPSVSYRSQPSGGSVWQPVMGVFAGIGELLGMLFGSVAGVGSKWLSPRLLPVLLVVGIWVGANFLLLNVSNSGYEHEVAAWKSMHNYFEEFSTLRKNEASESEWKTFMTRVDPDLANITKQLKRNASTDNAAAMKLLWASRDFMPKMLLDSRKEPSRHEDLFLSHLRQAERILSQSGELTEAPGGGK